MKGFCPKCEENIELNAELWHRNKSSKTGYAAVCKACINKENQGKKVPKGLITPEKDLTFQGIPKVEMKLGHKYKFVIPTHGNDKKVERFEGQVIQIENGHITFKHKLGFAETFLKWDLSTFNIKEV